MSNVFLFFTIGILYICRIKGWRNIESKINLFLHVFIIVEILYIVLSSYFVNNLFLVIALSIILSFLIFDLIIKKFLVNRFAQEKKVWDKIRFFYFSDYFLMQFCFWFYLYINLEVDYIALIVVIYFNLLALIFYIKKFKTQKK